ncbi:MAG: hypothetical protein ABIN37_01695 [Burkholderiaceae bacterium]
MSGSRAMMAPVVGAVMRAQSLPGTTRSDLHFTISTLTRVFGVSQNISGAYIASARDGVPLITPAAR